MPEQTEQVQQWPEVDLVRVRGQEPIFVRSGFEQSDVVWETERYLPASRIEGLSAEVIEAIDGMVTYLAESGLAEEGGGLALYQHTKRLAEARAALADLS